MGAPSARIFELSRRWAKKGAEVSVITGFPHHPTGIIPPEYRGKSFMRESREGISVIRTYVYATPNEGFFKRILSDMSFMLSSIIQGASQSGKQDIIIASSPQFFVGIAGYAISRLKNVPFIFEVRDLWPESIIQLGLLKNRLIIKMLEAIEMFLYHKAIHIVGVADSTVEILTKRGVPANKISIIKNGVDLELFNHLCDGAEVRRGLNSQNNFIISYIGTHGLSHALDSVLRTAELLKDQPLIKFLFIGEGAEKNNLIRQAKQLNLKNVKFIDQISKDDLPHYYAASDAVLVTLRNLPLFKCVIPSKIFEIMAMAKPILISVEGESKNLVVKDAKAGIAVLPENPQDLAKQILLIKKDQAYAVSLGKNGRNYVEKHFDRNELADQYLKLIEKLINAPK